MQALKYTDGSELLLRKSICEGFVFSYTSVVTADVQNVGELVSLMSAGLEMPSLPS